MSQRTKNNKGTKDARKITQFKRTGNYYYLERNSERNPKTLRNVFQTRGANLNHPMRIMLSAVVTHDLERLTGHISKGIN